MALRSLIWGFVRRAIPTGCCTRVHPVTCTIALRVTSATLRLTPGACTSLSSARSAALPRFHKAALIPQAANALAAEEAERGKRVVVVVDETHSSAPTSSTSYAC